MKDSVWDEGRVEISGMVWHGVVWFGLVGSADADHALTHYSPSLCEELHERTLCSGPAGAPVSE